MADLVRRVSLFLVSALAIAAVCPLRAEEGHTRKLSASSSAPGHPPALAMDGRRDTSWQSEAAGEQHLTIDFESARKLGGLAIAWEPELGAGHFIVEVSDDGQEWRTIRRVYGASGEKSWIRFPAAETRFLRLRLMEGDGLAFGIREIDVLPAAVATSADALVVEMAADARRGLFPRPFRGEPETSAPAAVGGDRVAALLSADGALEPTGSAFSVEPFGRVAGRILTWADVKTGTPPGEGASPATSVRWTSREVELDVTASRDGAGGSERVVVRYRLRNRTAVRLVSTLVLAIRPLLLRPEPDSAGVPSRVAPIRTISWDGRRILVNGDRFIFPLTAPASFSATTFAGGDVTSFLEAGKVPPERIAEDPAGFASGVLAYPRALEAGASAEVTLEIPVVPGGSAPPSFAYRRRP
ncbi:MAG: discoidin domain-containing protein [Thermoanaerobaculia bacterium]